MSLSHWQLLRPQHFPDRNVIALQNALEEEDMFCSGMCALPDHQRKLYYTHDGDQLRRIDFSNLGTDDLITLYRACKPAEFGWNRGSVLDESYRKAGKMDLTSFATLFDPCPLGIHQQISKALLVDRYPMMEIELYELNVYGPGDFFKAHKDTPRGERMFGSLVVFLPTTYKGGQSVLRDERGEWTLDFAEMFATSTVPSVCYVAFHGGVEHEILPVTSGYCVTLTYNLFCTPGSLNISSIPSPSFQTLKATLADVVNNKSKLPNGGYLGFGLTHEYVHTGQNLVELLEGQLKGSDHALANACEALGLHYYLRLFYRQVVGAGEGQISLITTKELNVRDGELSVFPPESVDYLRQALDGLAIEEVEGVVLVGVASPDRICEVLNDQGNAYDPWLREFYRDPLTEVLEVTRMKSSLTAETKFLVYGDRFIGRMGCFCGAACMLVAVDPAGSRTHIEL